MTRLREIRAERSKTAPGAFTLAAIAARLGVTESAVSRWERGINQPTKRHQRALARVLGVTVEELMGPAVAPAVESDETARRADRAAARQEWARQSAASAGPERQPSVSPGRPGGRSARP